MDPLEIFRIRTDWSDKYYFDGMHQHLADSGAKVQLSVLINPSLAMPTGFCLTPFIRNEHVFVFPRGSFCFWLSVVIDVFSGIACMINNVCVDRPVCVCVYRYFPQKFSVILCYFSFICTHPGLFSLDKDDFILTLVSHQLEPSIFVHFP